MYWCKHDVNGRPVRESLLPAEGVLPNAAQ
jgi:hypothetical protein